MPSKRKPGGAEYRRESGKAALFVHLEAVDRDRIRVAAALAGHPSIGAYVREVMERDALRVLKEHGVEKKEGK